MLELQTFGGLELRTGSGERVDALSGRTKCLAILAYLATEAPDERVPRDEIASLLWSEGTDRRARNSLRVALTHLRKATDGRLLVGEGEASLGLHREEISADVIRFREAVEAGDHTRMLELHRGDFLAGVRVPGARGFQRWADRRRGQFRHEAYEAALALGQSARERGSLADAEEHFRRALDLGPLREEAAAGLIRVLAERGRAADALRLFGSFRERRREELDLGPSEELQEFVEDLRAGPAGDRTGILRKGGSGRSEAPGRAVVSESPESPGGSSEGTGARWTVAAGLGALALLAALLAGGWYVLDGDGDSLAAVRERSVAVLPFEPARGQEAGPLTESLHASLLTRLSAVSDLEVASSSAVERFRETSLPVAAVADSLGVRWLVEGEVHQAGEEIRLHVRLVDPATGRQAWARSYRRRLTADDLFRIEAEVTEAIAGSLEARLAPEEERIVRRRPTGDLEAYRLYLEGRRLLNQRTEAKMRRAVALFRQALERDSSFALAWAGLADAATIIPSWGYELPDGMPDPGTAARRALALDPDLAEAHLVLAKIEGTRKGDYGVALLHYRRALELRPNLAQAHVYHALTLLQTGRPEAALERFERAVELDSHARLLSNGYAQIHLANGNPEEALRWAQRSPEFDLSFPVWELEAWTLYHLGRLEDARALLADARGAPNRAVLALVHAGAGDTARAREILGELEAAPGDRFWSGLVRAGLGDVDGAFEAFGSVEDWPGMKVRTLRYLFPDVLGPVRRDPRYESLMAEVNRAIGLARDGSVPDSTVEAFARRYGR